MLPVRLRILCHQHPRFGGQDGRERQCQHPFQCLVAGESFFLQVDPLSGKQVVDLGLQRRPLLDQQIARLGQMAHLSLAAFFHAHLR